MEDLKQAAAQIYKTRQAAPGRASPGRGGWLGEGPFVGEVAEGDSLSFATSSPTYTDTDTHTVRDGEGSAMQEVRFMRPRGVNTVYTTGTLDILCVAF